MQRWRRFLVIISSILSFSSIMTNTEAFPTTAKDTARPRDEKDQRLSPWSERWANQQLGWHKTDVHESLLEYGNRIIPGFDKVCDGAAEESVGSQGVRILVPLCGKTVDMAFLAQQPNVDQVVGVDGVRRALDEFAQEHPNLGITDVSGSCPSKSYELLEGKNIALLKGDFFELNETATKGKVDAVWDRASIVAIQPNMREAYVGVMAKLLKPGGIMLMSTFDRRTGTSEGMNAGPPFSVPEKEIRRLYEEQEWVESVELVKEVDEFKENPERKERYLSQGVTGFFELVFLIKARSDL